MTMGALSQVGEQNDQEMTTGMRGWRGIVVAIIFAYLAFKAGGHVLLVIGALVVSIVLHEFGHYAIARISGMKVTEFFVGFGPKLWSFRRGETEYGFKLIPAGAYVRIIGMSNMEEVDTADITRTYRAKNFIRRVATVLAGPAMNIILGFGILTMVTASTGFVDDKDWSIHTVVPGSSAEVAGIESGDQILSIDGSSLTTFEDFSTQLHKKAGKDIQIAVQRNGEIQNLHGTLGWGLNKKGADAIPSRPTLPERTLVKTLDGKSVVSYESLATDLAIEGEPVLLGLEINGESYELSVTRPVLLPVDGARGFFGVAPRQEVQDVSLFGSIGVTGKQVATMSGQFVSGIGKLLSPISIFNLFKQAVASKPKLDTTIPELMPIANAPVLQDTQDINEQESRPVSIVGIVQIGSEAAKTDWMAFWQVLAMVNIFLAFINLLPLLPFDGGHATVATYEWIVGWFKGKQYRVDMARLMPITYVVVLLLVGLGTASLLLDIRNPLANPYGP